MADKMPLNTINGPETKLPRPPMSKLRRPTPVKRPRSSDELPSDKRFCPDVDQSKTASTRSGTVRLSSESSNPGTKQKTSGSNLRAQNSGSSIRGPNVAGNVRTQSSSSSLQRQKSGSSLTTKTSVNLNQTNVFSKPRPLSQTQFTGRPSQVASRVMRSASTSSNKVVSKSTVNNSKPPVAPSGTKPASSGSSKSRPKWDIKGRLEDMELLLHSQSSERSSMQTKMEECNSQISALQNQLSCTTAQKQEKEQAVMATTEQVDRLNKLMREQQDTFDSTKTKLQHEISDITFIKDSLERKCQQFDCDLQASRTQITALRDNVALLTAAKTGVSAELDNVKLLLEASAKREADNLKEIQELKDLVSNQKESLADYNTKCIEHESERRTLHNTIQELKGNIRVFCRVRPQLKDGGTNNHISFPDFNKIEMEKVSDPNGNEMNLAASQRGGKHDFTFDRVFTPACDQKDVFGEVQQVIQSALDGYNVCIFAYGQTGSGKTHTMQGGAAPESHGIIPRAVLQIFDTIKSLETTCWNYEMEASFLEIYNETIRDLLGNSKEEKKHEIRKTGNGNHDVFVTNLTEITVTTEGQIHDLLRKSAENRAVAETKCNEHSSRSHSVFRLKLSGKNTKTGETCKGTLHLVDLAGSERVKNSGSEGQRLKEALAINRSLSELGNVIMAIGKQDSHVPYRNSKLTYLLQNSLGGNSKTLMFVNLSPQEDCFSESLNSLRFATSVNHCHIGTATQKKGK